MKKRKSVRRRRRVRVKPLGGYDRGHAKVDYKPINNKSPKDWELGYELVCSFMYGLDEEIIAKIAGLRNYDTGITMSGPGEGVRDLMFPCGTSLELAQTAAKRLRGADHFGALRLRISYPTEIEGKSQYTSWYDVNGRLIERIKHRKRGPFKVVRAKAPKRKTTGRNAV